MIWPIPTPPTVVMLRPLAKMPTLLDEPIREAKRVIAPVLDGGWWEKQLEHLIIIAIVLAATIVVLRLGRRTLLKLQATRSIPDRAMLPIRRFLRWLVLVTALLVTLQLLGVPMSLIWTGASTILALVAIGFVAVWSVLSNITASLLLLIFKPFRIGDYVEFADTNGEGLIAGRVVDLTLMHVTLREAAEGEEPAHIQIPNNIFFQRPIRRRSGPRSVALEDHVDKHGLTGREKSPPDHPEI